MVDGGLLKFATFPKLTVEYESVFEDVMVAAFAAPDETARTATPTPAKNDLFIALSFPVTLEFLIV